MGDREREREVQHKQPQGSIDSLSFFIFSLRNDGNTHSEPPHLNAFMATAHSGQTIHAISSPSLLTLYPSSQHPLLFFHSVSQSFLFHTSQVQDEYLTFAKKKYLNFHMESQIWTEFSLVIFSRCDGFHMGLSHRQKGAGKKSWGYTYQV